MKTFKRAGLPVALILTLAVLGCGTDSNTAQPNGHDHHEATEQTAASQPVWKLTNPTPQAGQDDRVTFQLLDANSKPITAFDTVHEKKLHLIVVSQDLSYFNHLHPEPSTDGLFTQTLNLPQGGRYKLIADVTPTGQNAASYGQWIDVGGNQVAKKPIELDTDMTKTIAGQQVTLTFDSPPQAGQAAMMTFHLENAATHQPTTDLEPYLGAVGHVVALSSDAEQYLHVHPMDEKGHGPDAMFHIEFPSSGLYKVWGQFQRKGEVFVVPFVVKVP
ncbi:hypothetical protein JJB07_07540 [Tumebacillus sp. ITR2]|uniref:Secreted protein n=1 Tax=Tumebacillus amylolyticus TaxID=2801339 RepID=A0ABS1J895_9BACL|nr:hypothetical protein [Tumebacillus amylolyticus]MBL0386498.1 hypothetical protein [Tumebacillus amylolyticus]